MTATDRLQTSSAGKAIVSMIALLLAACDQKVDVLAGRNDDARTGANLQEAKLTPQLLRKQRFGKLYSYDVDGFVYAQPLVVSGISTQFGTRDLLLIATTKNKVYAFDADHGTPNIIWQQDLTGSGTLAESPSAALVALAPSVGILSTPVIDKASKAIYLVSRTYEQTQHVQRLYKIALDSGNVIGAAKIDAAVQANGNSFNPEVQINRPGLALVKGMIVTLWGTFLDGEKAGTERGWAIAFDKDTLMLRGTFCTTCYGGASVGGMIWQAGRPPAVESDRFIYFFTGNGWLQRTDKGRQDGKEDSYIHSCDPHTSGLKPSGYLAESLIRLDVQAAAQWSTNSGYASWTPFDWCELDQNDTDLGGSGPMLLSTAEKSAIVFGGGKAGVLYSVDSGKITSPDLVEWQSPAALTGGLPRFSTKLEAINECIDFENVVVASMARPPYNSFLVAHVDVPANFAKPWAVDVGPAAGGEHGSAMTSSLRPLCAPLDPTPVSYGRKHDHELHHLMAGPVFLPRAGAPPTELSGTLFVAPENLPVLAFEIEKGRLQGNPSVTQIDFKKFPFATFITSHHPGGMLAVSASSAAGSGIVWVTHYRDSGKGSDATFEIQGGVLEALDASTMELLWSSDANAADNLGYFQKFTPPTVANGKVFVISTPSPKFQDCAIADLDNCRAYNHAGSDGKVVAYGELSRFWPPWKLVASVRHK